MSARPLPLGRYARRVARALSEAAERPVVLSPRDWDRVAGWSERGVPLTLVLEALADAVERRRRDPRRARRPLDVGTIAAAVEEAWAVVCEGRAPVGARAPDPRMARSTARDAWRAVADAAETPPALREALQDLLRRLDGGEPVEELDRRLDGALAAAVGPGRLAAARERALSGLERYRGRMPAEAFRTSRDRATADGLRRELGLPRLSLSDPAR